MKTLRKVALFLLLFVPLGIFAQTVSGTVTEKSNGAPLPGVNVLVKGTTTGTTSDFDGKYQISANTGDILIFSYIGFKTVEITVSGGTLDVAMEEDAAKLDEVVVVGYGSSTKKDLTGAVESVSTKDFNGGAIAAPEQLLAGKTAGLQVIPPSGAPGSGGTIRVRGGTSSLSAGNNPLIVVDGVPLDQTGQGALNYINPNDIESFTVLKDASAASIYGSRATAGVVLITTKSGNAQTPLRFNYNSYISFGTNTDKVDVLSAEQFRQTVNQFGNANEIALLTDSNTDWQDEIYRTAVTSNHNFTVTKGFKNSSIRASLGYINQDGTLRGTNFERTSAAIKYVHRLLDNSLKIEGNIRGALVNDEFGNQGAIGAAIAFDPTKPIRSGNDAFGGFFEWTNTDGSPNTISPRNPLGLIELTDNSGNTRRVTGNLKLDYDIPYVDGLKATVNLGFDYNDFNGLSIVDPNSAATTQNGTTTVSDALNRNRLADLYLNYTTDIESIKSKIDVTGGYSYQRFFRSGRSVTTDGNGTVTAPTPFATQNSLISYFGRLNYSYDDRYLVTVNYRNDASSRLNPRDRRQGFGGVSVAWNLINEKFIQDSNIFSNLKIRAGYAETGQQEINQDFGYLPRFTTGDDQVRYQFGNEFVTTIRPEEFDPNIRWEISKTYNFGLDYGFFNNRLNGSVEVYFRDVEDVLNFISVPAGTNLSNALVTNIGNLENSGVEFTINAVPVQTEDFTWNANFNISFFDNEITKLTLTDDPSFQGNPTGGIAGGVGNTIQINSVGFEQNSYFVFQQVYDGAGNPIEGLYVDTNGDGQITPDDRVRFKSPNPNATIGFSSNFIYKKFDMSFTFRGSFGNYNYNNVASDRGNLAALTGANVISNVNTSFLETGFQNPQLFSDFYVQDASFVKLDNINLGYNFGKIFNDRADLRVYSTVQNVFTITDYDGLDPEVAGGIDNNFFPRARTFLLGLDVNF
ncbi:SusC/RagA family TonB-linked outer membrane protein [Leptobacterium flavescens]|uniref:SusC/RagA family TonB-linked outer membrane protein n=1 Tax=Leptobacterium flavescens TaxID=472055 RepID=A0A6P0US70_9FLAO|nr:TonB-dependent receptor [Leptobacterium flavescens]NER14649.1 SusC/RagA family TonB-linked outer membrane protein [Leptobacterium flavescens]